MDFQTLAIAKHAFTQKHERAPEYVLLTPRELDALIDHPRSLEYFDLNKIGQPSEILSMQIVFPDSELHRRLVANDIPIADPSDLKPYA